MVDHTITKTAIEDGKTYITISQEYFDHLTSRNEFLDCLESAGVDNWHGYDIAQDMFSGDYDFD